MKTTQTTETQTPAFIPSNWRLNKMIESAMARCDADIEQAALAKEEREIRRMERALSAAAAARGRRARWGC